MTPLTPPPWFEAIRDEAARTWDERAERDPEAVASIQHLFEQVRAGAQVLSELMQNADDAGAAHVRVRLQDGALRFEHDGQDFTQQDFRALCRFSLSNKRVLHTIGFRGIGFKSTFSLGPVVHVQSPTLSVAFDEHRFTIPRWVEPGELIDCTRITVPLTTSQDGDLRAQLAAWSQQPTSLLFFRHIRTVEFEHARFSVQDHGEGPVPNSRRVTIDDGSGKASELIRIDSADEPFPQDALDELKERRAAGVGSVDARTWPPCKVQIILGLPSPQLFSILPSGQLADNVPFACNAPFMQNPDRRSLTPLHLSPTNRWLFRRIGTLAANTMLVWLRRNDLSMIERARAYRLLPNVVQDASKTTPESKAIVEAVRTKLASERAWVLGADGHLHAPETSSSLPGQVLETWDESTCLRLFASRSNRIAPEVKKAHVGTLKGWGVEIVAESRVIEQLGRTNPPCPATPDKLLRLWSFVDEQTRNSWNQSDFLRTLRIAHLTARPTLAPLADGAGPLPTDATPEEQAWIARHLESIDPAFIDFLEHATRRDERAAETVERIKAASRFAKPQAWDEVAQRLAVRIFSDLSVPSTIDDAVRFAHTLARHDLAVPDKARFRCADGQWRKPSAPLLTPVEEGADPLRTPDTDPANVLHSSYVALELSTEDRRSWETWCRSSKSPFTTVHLPTALETKVKNVGDWLKAKGSRCEVDMRRRSATWAIEDFRFSQSVERHWDGLASSTPDVWARVLRELLHGAAPRHLIVHRHMTAVERWNYGRKAKNPTPITDVPATWIAQLRDRRCLPDADGGLHHPWQLYRDTRDTNVLRGVSPFLDPDLDKPEHHAILDLLGVNSRADARPLIDRIDELSRALSPDPDEVANLFASLDILARRAPEALRECKIALSEGPRVPAQDSTWYRLSDVFRGDDESVIGFPVVLESVRALPLWERIGMASAPSPKALLERLAALRPDQRLSGGDLRFVKAALKRVPREAWDQGSWLSISDQWRQRSDLRWSLWKGVSLPAGFFKKHQASVADLRMVERGELPSAPPAIDERLQQKIRSTAAEPPVQEAPIWFHDILRALHHTLPAEATASRERLGELRRCAWRSCETLSTAHWLDGEQVSDWQPTKLGFEPPDLYLRQGLSASELHEELAEILLTACPPDDEREARRKSLLLCVDRDAAYIEDAFRRKWTWLEALDEPTAPSPSPDSQAPSAEPPPPPIEAPVSNTTSSAPSPSTAPTPPAPRAPVPERPSVWARFAASRGMEAWGDGYRSEEESLESDGGHGRMVYTRADGSQVHVHALPKDRDGGWRLDAVIWDVARSTRSDLFLMELDDERLLLRSPNDPDVEVAVARYRLTVRTD